MKYRRYVLPYKLTPLLLAYIDRNDMSAGLMDSSVRENLLNAGAKSGLVTVDGEDRYTQRLVLTDKGRAKAISAKMHDLFYENVKCDANESSRRALLLFMVMYGMVGPETYYSGPSKLGDRLEAFHILSCGIDDATRTPWDEKWTSFCGTFAEDDRHSGLVTSITCQCGLVSEQEYLVDTEDMGIAQMLIKTMELANQFS